MRWPRRRPALVTVAAAAVAVGLLPMPGEYYGLLLIFLCGSSLYYLAQPAVPDRAKWLLVALALLHNPIAPIGLGNKIVWAVVNAGTVFVFWMVSRRITRASRW